MDLGLATCRALRCCKRDGLISKTRRESAGRHPHSHATMSADCPQPEGAVVYIARLVTLPLRTNAGHAGLPGAGFCFVWAKRELGHRRYQTIAPVPSSRAGEWHSGARICGMRARGSATPSPHRFPSMLGGPSPPLLARIGSRADGRRACGDFGAELSSDSDSAAGPSIPPIAPAQVWGPGRA